MLDLSIQQYYTDLPVLFYLYVYLLTYPHYPQRKKKQKKKRLLLLFIPILFIPPLRHTRLYTPIIGAGPAGLTAAYERVQRTGIKSVIIEMTDSVGGISRTFEYNGNHIDAGGRRFFSKSEKVIDWCLSIFPLQGKPAEDDIILKGDVTLFDLEGAPDPEIQDKVMLSRERVSRIFFKRSFFDYPISLSFATPKGLGLFNVIKIGLSYIFIKIFPVKLEKNLEDFFINRFGKVLYRIFFKDYTEKVWGLS